MYAFQSEYTLYSCVNVKEFLARSRRGTSNQEPLIGKQSLNHLVKLTTSLKCVLSIYLYGAFDCMFL